MQGGTIDSPNENLLTPYDIFFNKVLLTDVNFMDVNVTEGNAKTDTVKLMRAAVAKWYYVMRLIASIILLAILVVVGIKMAISSVAEEKALYKKALVDWAVSLALIFLLQFIISFTVMCNSALVKSLEAVGQATSGPGNGIAETLERIKSTASWNIGWEAIAATIVFVAISVQTLAFLFQYIKRMINIGFLIIISPLISITYSIDRMGDGKSQALNTWLKEFVFGVLIQPFHCVLYLAFVDMAFTLLTNGGDAIDDIANGALAVMCITFVDDGEKLVKKIFGLDASSAISPVAAGAMLGATAAFASKNAPQMLAGAKKGITNFTQKGLGSKIAKDHKNRLTNKFQKNLGSTSKEALDRAGLHRGKDGAILDKDNNQVDDKTAAERLYETRTTRSVANKVAHPIRSLSSRHRSNGIAKEREKLGDADKLAKDGVITADEAAAMKDTSNQTAEAKSLRESANKKINKKATENYNAAHPKSKIGGYITNSETYKYLRSNVGGGKLLGKAAAGGAALFAASAGLAAPGQGVLAAATAGLGTYAALKGLGSNSVRTEAEITSKYLQTDSREDTIREVNRIDAHGKNGDYNELSNQFRSLEAKLLAAFKQAGAKDPSDAVNKAMAQIKSQATKDPSKLDSDALKGILQAAGGVGVTSAMFDAGSAVKQHVCDANVYRELSKMQEAGYTNESFASKVFDAQEFSKPLPNMVFSAPTTASSSSTDSASGGSASSGGDIHIDTTPPPTDPIDATMIASRIGDAIAAATPGDGEEPPKEYKVVQELTERIETEVKHTMEIGNYDEARRLVEEINSGLSKLSTDSASSSAEISGYINRLQELSTKTSADIASKTSSGSSGSGDSGKA